MSKVKFLNHDIELPEHLSGDIDARLLLANIEYIELTRGDGLWFLQNLSKNYSIRINDDSVEQNIISILENNQTKGLNAIS